MRRGFTLIEILVTLLVFGLLLSLSVLTFSRFLDSLKLNGTAKQVASDLRLSQEKAMAEHTMYQIAFEKEKSTYVIGKDDLFEGGKVEIKTIELPRRLYFEKSKTIKFAASGFPPPGGSGTVVIRTKSGGSKKVIVSSVGRVRIE